MIIIRCEIEPSTNKKEKNTMYIWVSKKESEDEKILQKIKDYKKIYQTVTFISGTESMEKFFHDFITYSGIKY